MHRYLTYLAMNHVDLGALYKFKTKQRSFLPQPQEIFLECSCYVEDERLRVGGRI